MRDRTLLETYKRFLKDYSLEQLRYIPEPGVWSLCQMYDHLIIVANEYLDCAEACAEAHSMEGRGKTDFGEYLFANGGFPPEKIRLPDEMNAPPDNTKSTEELMLELDQLIIRIEKVENTVQEINPQNKVKHGGIGWMNAVEWTALVGMHFRHHLRQKYELDQRISK
ncbi:DinB family protein [Jeotgalibacillus proteolyticus]|uniref:DinB family protein n=1 Tax=Jeotgalibacillus proteolyticus TaxID=2082395 RepID=A0A2S5G7Z2_9BACL|nr:DinB family protein [Jeotgalibacillus proteolyticus]PPA69106.1 DinB family protein [Jeotgalibacillus proteolyticus]